MADQLELTAPGATPPGPEPTPAPEPPKPTSEEELQRLREENARLQGENAALKTVPKAPEPAKAADPFDTLEGIKAAFDKGEISDDDRILLISRLGARKEREDQEQRTRQLSTKEKANKKLGEYIDKYPALADPSSKLLQAVSDECRAMAELGFNPEDVSVQVQAVEKVLARSTAPAVNPDEFNRRKIPVGGPGGGGPSPTPQNQNTESPGKKIFDRLTPEAQEFFTHQRNGDMAAVYRTLEYADEGMLRRAGRFAQ